MNENFVKVEDRYFFLYFSLTEQLISVVSQNKAILNLAWGRCSSVNEIRCSKLELSQICEESLCLKQRSMLNLPWRIRKITENQQVLIVQPWFCTSNSKCVYSVAVSKINLGQLPQPSDADSLKISVAFCSQCLFLREKMFQTFWKGELLSTKTWFPEP